MARSGRLSHHLHLSSLLSPVSALFPDRPAPCGGQLGTSSSRLELNLPNSPHPQFLGLTLIELTWVTRPSLNQ